MVASGIIVSRVRWRRRGNRPDSLPNPKAEQARPRAKVFGTVQDLILHTDVDMKRSLHPRPGLTTAAMLVLTSALLSAQTKITPPPNNYTPAQDVELGQKAAADARQQLPIM